MDREGSEKSVRAMEMMTDQMAAGLLGAAGFNRNQIPRFGLGAGLPGLAGWGKSLAWWIGRTTRQRTTPPYLGSAWVVRTDRRRKAPSP